MIEHRGFAWAEIGLVPAIDARNDELAVLDAPPASIIDVGASALLQQPLRILGGEGNGREAGTADRGAIERVVQARIVPDRPQDAVLDVIEAQPLALGADHLRIPWADAEQAGPQGNVANAPCRIVIENDARRDGVVEIDPVGSLLPAIESRDRRGLERREVTLQDRAA